MITPEGRTPEVRRPVWQRVVIIGVAIGVTVALIYVIGPSVDIRRNGRMLLRQLAIVVDAAPDISASQVAAVAAALQKQATRDFGPLWQVDATVDAFPSLDDVPIGYWPIIIRADIGNPAAAGIHLDPNGQPMALVEATPQWPLTASHECLEMLADPTGFRMVAGPSIMPGQGRVEYLVEVADPCEDPSFAYTVNGCV